MAALPTIKLINREDLKDAPDWIERLLTPLNQFMGATYTALRTLTFQQNIRSSVRELRFDTPADYTTGGFPELEFDTGIGVKAIGVQMLQIWVHGDTEAVITGAPVPNWIERAGKIKVKYVSGLENSTKYTARFLVF